MSPLIKDLYHKANLAHIDLANEETLGKMGYSPDQIKEIVKEFLDNQPDNIYKAGDCPRCGSDVDCSYPGFDAQTFRCSCGLEFKGNEAEDVYFWIKLK